MRLNAETAVVCNKIMLIPYQESHVVTYSHWMSDEDLRKATASERLLLEDEYAMQKSWRNDPDKLTFITASPPAKHEALECVKEGEHDTSETLVGDVNLFLYSMVDDDDDEEEDRGEHLAKPTISKLGGEVELMVAVPGRRGKGLGKTALLSFLRYVVNHADELANQLVGTREPLQQQQNGQPQPELSILTAKIDKDNTPSLKLFESLGFERKGGPGAVNYFGEAEFKMPITGDTRSKIDELMSKAGIAGWQEIRYIPN